MSIVDEALKEYDCLPCFLKVMFYQDRVFEDAKKNYLRKYVFASRTMKSVEFRLNVGLSEKKKKRGLSFQIIAVYISQRLERFYLVKSGLFSFYFEILSIRKILGLKIFIEAFINNGADLNRTSKKVILTFFSCGKQFFIFLLSAFISLHFFLMFLLLFINCKNKLRSLTGFLLKNPSKIRF